MEEARDQDMRKMETMRKIVTERKGASKRVRGNKRQMAPLPFPERETLLCDGRLGASSGDGCELWDHSLRLQGALAQV